MTGPKREIWTIGHSTRTLEEFIALLNAFCIRHLVDIRTFPGSRRYPHFNKEILSKALQEEGIRYTHMVDLGGRRKPLPDSTNTVWRHASFRGYADYMETPPFTMAIEKLEAFAATEVVAYMCSEAVWWKCHRALVSDYLKAHGWTVCHIMDEGKSQEHPYTKPAREAQGKLF